MIDTTRRIVFASCTALAIGVAIGAFASIHLFAVDVDLLSLPYINEGVTLADDVEIEQNGRTIIVPKGTELTWVRRMPGGDAYTLQILSLEIHAPVKTEPIPERAASFVTRKRSN